MDLDDREPWNADPEGVRHEVAVRRQASGRARRPIIATSVAVAGLITLLAAGGLAGIMVVGGRAGVVGSHLAVDHPRQWDPRVTDLVAFVERERGLRFKHPVTIDFLDDAAFRAVMTEREALDEADQEEIRSTEALLRAVGFLSGSVDLLAAGDELAGDGAIGAYVPEEERVLIRGTTLDDARRSTLVHELTHVLQDQHFTIDRYDDDESRTSGQDAAFTAVVEADAEDVEEAWRATLPAAALDAMENADAASAGGTDFQGVPEVFVELMSFPYVFGPPFLQAVEATEGAAGRNRLLTEPPSSEEHILVPETYIGRQSVVDVKAPALREGEKALPDAEGDVGMLSLLVMLGERVDFGVAWPAVQGWAGDAFVAFERAGATCVRARVEFDAPAQAERFSAAFAAWSKGRPATQVRNGGSVLFESCDPGAAAPGRAAGHVSGIQGLGLRQGILTGIEGGPISPKAAACITDGLLARMTADRLVKTTRPGGREDRALAAEIQRNVTELVPGCR